MDRINAEMMSDEGKGENRLRQTYHRVRETECAKVMDFIERFDDSDGRNLCVFRFGLRKSSYNRLSVRSRMFQRMHHFYAYENNGEIISLMCVAERPENGCVSRRIAEVEMLLTRHEDSGTVHELDEFLMFVEGDLIHRLSSEVAMLRFVIEADNIGNCSDLGNALTRLGYSEEGHFGGLRKVNDVVLLSKQLKKR